MAGLRRRQATSLDRAPNGTSFSVEPVAGLRHPTLTPRGDGSTSIAAIEVGATRTMITRTKVQAVAAVAKAHRRTSMRFCEWTSSAPVVTGLALDMRGGDRGSPDFMRR